MSVSKLARQRGKILDEIMGYHREQLPKIMRDVPLADVRAFARTAGPTVSLTAALSRPGVGLIAECKKASPSKGLLVPHYNPVELARTYVHNGASAVSVLTDARHFQGSLEDLRDVSEALEGVHSPLLRQRVSLLRKDFIFHPYQVYEARAAGADALLLIVAVLSDTELRELLAQVGELKMEALVEVHDEAELARALALPVQIIGINNRNLQTFEVDLQTTERLRRLVPDGIPVVAESGIRTPEDVTRVAAAGVDGVLVGESLVTSKNTAGMVRKMVEAGRSAR
ncbi:MAG: indole-3-glycerol phosphate synthase TrpC [Anaerolineae bacterium]|nr:indole-3-glycerol phosphate synthase TrpC [Anaerolineae bacterium]